MARKGYKVKLPERSPRGGRLRQHPLVRGLAKLRAALNLSEIARALGVSVQTLWIWEQEAKADRHFLLPAERVPLISKMTGIAPWEFRPDLWPNPEWRFK